MDLDALVPSNSKYLAKNDVGEDGKTLTIKGFTRVDMEDGSRKACIHWVEENVKPMILNRTNTDLLKWATGETDTDQIKGKKVRIYADPTVAYAGKMVGGLRVGKAKAAAPVAEPAGDLDGDIPF
jgi:hypothetical protein